MKIRVEVLGLPALAEAVGQRETELEVSEADTTVKGALDHLIQRFGPSVREAIYDRRGALNPIIQIALNGRRFVAPDRLDTALQEGDTLTFMLLMAGGSGPGSFPAR